MKIEIKIKKSFFGIVVFLLIIDNMICQNINDSLKIYNDGFKASIYSDAAKAKNFANLYFKCALKVNKDTSVTKGLYNFLSLAAVSGDSVEVLKNYTLMKNRNFKKIPSLYYMMNNAMTVYFVNSGQSESSRFYINQNIKTKLKDADGLAIAYANLALVCNNAGKQDSNIYYLLLADKIVTQNKVNDRTKMIIDNYLMVGYYNISDYKKAIQSGFKSLAIVKKAQYVSMIPDIYSNIIGSYIGLYDFKNAEIQLDSMRKYIHHNPIFEGNYLMHKAEIEKQKGNIMSSLKLLNESYEFLKDNGNPFYLRNTINDLIRVKWLIKEREGYTALTATAYSKCSGILETTDTLLYNKANMYERLSKLSTAMADTLLRDFYKAEAFNEANEKAKLQELTQKYNEEKKIIENEILTQNLERQKLISGIILLSLLMLGGFVMMLYRQRKSLKESNQIINKSKDEIQVLNKELVHRVKNNIGLATALLEMQGKRVSSSEAKEVILAGESRLRTLSLVHQHLLNDEHLQNIDIKKYIIELMDHLKTAYLVSDKILTIEENIEPNTMDGDVAMRVGLILNEKVTNSVKHAFEGVINPTIYITCKFNAGIYEVHYKDNGKSIDKNTEYNQGETSLGTTLISLIAGQIHEKVVFK